jgi:hypothetical protein
VQHLRFKAFLRTGDSACPRRFNIHPPSSSSHQKMYSNQWFDGIGRPFFVQVSKMCPNNKLAPAKRNCEEAPGVRKLNLLRGACTASKISDWRGRRMKNASLNLARRRTCHRGQAG